MYDSWCNMKHRDKESVKLSRGGHTDNVATGTLDFVHEELGGRETELLGYFQMTMISDY